MYKMNVGNDLQIYFINNEKKFIVCSVYKIFIRLLIIS